MTMKIYFGTMACAWHRQVRLLGIVVRLSPHHKPSRFALGRRARRVAFLSPSGSPPKVFSVGQSERCSVSTVRRSIIFMRDSNFIKKEEKYIPHFRRTELFTSGGGTPEGKEGEQYSHVRGRQFILPPSTTKPAGRGEQYSHVRDVNSISR